MLTSLGLPHYDHFWPWSEHFPLKEAFLKFPHPPQYKLGMILQRAFCLFWGGHSEKSSTAARIRHQFSRFHLGPPFNWALHFVSSIFPPVHFPNPHRLLPQLFSPQLTAGISFHIYGVSFPILIPLWPKASLWYTPLGLSVAFCLSGLSLR